MCLGKNRNIRVKKLIREYLSDGKEKSTLNIYDYLNSRLKNGVVMHTLCNLLGKEKDFMKGDLIHGSDRDTRNYAIRMWSLKDS